MKNLLVVVGLCAILSAPAGAQEAKPAVAPADATRYLELLRHEAELSGQFNLAKELTGVHTQRAQDAERENKAEKIPWERDLAKELQDRANALSAELETVTKERTALEEKSKLSFPLLSATVGDNARALTADESAYLTRVDALLFTLDQDLSQIVSTGKLYAATLQTNNAPEDVARVAAQVQENDRMQKQLEREKDGLEVQKLLFRALKK